MLQDDERDLPEGTQLILGLTDRHRGTKRKISLDAQATPTAEEAQAGPCESKGSNDAAKIPEESPLVRHTQWSLWMGPGFLTRMKKRRKRPSQHISQIQRTMLLGPLSTPRCQNFPPEFLLFWLCLQVLLNSFVLFQQPMQRHLKILEERILHQIAVQCTQLPGVGHGNIGSPIGLEPCLPVELLPCFL